MIESIPVSCVVERAQYRAEVKTDKDSYTINVVAEDWKQAQIIVALHCAKLGLKKYEIESLVKLKGNPLYILYHKEG